MMTLRGAIKNDKRPFKVLVVGTGSIGKRHIKNLLLLGQTDLHAFRTGLGSCDPVTHDLRFTSYFDFEEALAAEPEVVVISNPTALHVPFAHLAAQRGCHVFLEKPVSNSLDGIEDLIAMGQQQKLVIAVGYNLRFHRALLALQERICRKEIGDVVSVRCWAGQYLPDWHPEEDYRRSYMANPELGGGVILTLSHELDCLYWLFGAVSEVTAVAAKAPHLDMLTESIAEITLTFRSGLLGQIHLDCVQRTRQRGYEVIGTEGTLALDLIESTIRMIRPSPAHCAEVIHIFQPDSNQMYLDEMSDFLEAIETGRKPRVPLEDGAEVLKIALAAHRAARSGIRQACE